MLAQYLSLLFEIDRRILRISGRARPRTDLPVQAADVVRVALKYSLNPLMLTSPLCTPNSAAISGELLLIF